nr:SIR2 family protein [Lysobacter sp. M15]
MLQGLKDRGYWLDLITTNYDLVLEYATQYQKLDLGFGKSFGVLSRLDVELWRRSIHESEFVPYADGLITKLHGSLNWENDRGDVVFGGTTFRARHEHHAIIYPGFKGIPSKQPFSTLHEYFEHASRKADLLVFIGFAFRDDYINSILSAGAISKRVLVVDPGTIKIPKSLETTATHIRSGFDANSVSEVLGYIDGS